MAGYIGSKAVTLSTTAADVTGDATINGNLTVNGTTVTIDSAAAQEIRLGDNDKMTFGDATGGDLQIYHDGSHSYIKDAGTGDLILQGSDQVKIQTTTGETMVSTNENNAVVLYFDNDGKLATTSTGINVTGGVTTDAYSYLNGLRISGGDTGNTVYQQSGDLSISSASGSISLKPSGTNILHATSTAVGIGTSSPSFGDSAQGLEVKRSGGNVTVRVNYDGSAQGQFTATSSSIKLETRTSGIPLVFGTAAVERMRIDSSGNVGIGTSSPSSYASTTLEISGSSTTSDLKMTNTTTGTGNTAGYDLELNGSDINYVNRTASGNQKFWTNATERMRIDSSGSVGIGSTNPIGSAQRLYIDHPASYQTALPTVKIRRANNVGGGSSIDEIALDVSVPSSYNNAYFVYGIKTYARHNLYGRQIGIYSEVGEANSDNSVAGYFKGGHSDTNGISKPRIVYIQQTTTIGASNSGYSIGCYIKQDNYTKNEFMRWDTDYSGSDTMNALRIYRNGSQIGGITTTTSGTAYNTSSDYRLKENVTDVTDGITRVKQLAPKRFNFIAEPDKVVDGFIAHEAQAVVPEAVTGTQDAVDVEGNPEYQGIDQSKLVPLLTAALQEAIAKIETLETEMTSVKARLDALEAN